MNIRCTPELRAGIESAAVDYAMSMASMSDLLVAFGLCAYKADPRALDRFIAEELARRVQRKSAGS